MKTADSSQAHKLKYRPDVDGLRCIAVLSVLAFHLSPGRVSGGFVGVDVFFVISGYLISSMIVSEVNAGTFSLAAFYDRRIRRIFPALFGMLIGLCIIAWLLFLPAELVAFAKSAIAATASVSNFYFWTHSGYFDSPLSRPLLHTWSLAVEEQFYLTFPLLLLITRRFSPSRLRAVILVLFFISLAVSAFTVVHDEKTAFYMPYTRAWELLLGTILSLGAWPKMRGAIERNLATLIGIGMIGWSVLRYTPHTRFPGLAALLPCVGTALIIGAGEHGRSLISACLAWRPVVFIGLISYSLYLWHWPLVVLSQYGILFNLGTAVPHKWAYLLSSQSTNKLFVILFSFIAAILSWRFVERPFRSYPRRIQRRPLFYSSGAIATALILLSALVINAHGFERRFPARAVRVASVLFSEGGGDPTLGQWGKCTITESTKHSVFTNPSCDQIGPGKGGYLLLGDSHAASLWPGLTLRSAGRDVQLASVWGCRLSIHPTGSAVCDEAINYVLNRYLETHPGSELLLEAQWYPGSLQGLSEILQWTKDHNIKTVIFGPVAEYDSPLPRLLAYSIAWNRPDLPQRHLADSSRAMDERMQSLGTSTWNVPYVSLYRATCDSKGCAEYADSGKDIPLMRDGDHLSKEGAALLVKRLVASGELRLN